jgi:hypothetical protein
MRGSFAGHQLFDAHLSSHVGGGWSAREDMWKRPQKRCQKTLFRRRFRRESDSSWALIETPSTWAPFQTRRGGICLPRRVVCVVLPSSKKITTQKYHECNAQRMRLSRARANLLHLEHSIISHSSSTLTETQIYGREAFGGVLSTSNIPTTWAAPL